MSASGYRLPTEAEREYAAAKGASGQTERAYPWGNTWDSSYVVCKVSPASATATAVVGSKSPDGDTPQGLADMSGNVAVCCSDNCQSVVSSGTDLYYFDSDSTTANVVFRGGAWPREQSFFLFCSYRTTFVPPAYEDNAVSFRVVRR
jgi:gamma-glutamyl hercynylcysteine S-oxide synthase